MSLAEGELRKILLEESYVSALDMEKSETAAKRHDISLIDQLITDQFITPELLGQAISEKFKTHFIDLGAEPPDRNLVQQIPEEIGRASRVVLVQISDDGIGVTTDTPDNPKLVDVLSELFPDRKIEIGYSLPEQIEVAFKLYLKTLQTRFAGIIKNQGKVAPEIIEEIFEDAIGYFASDIHFEPQEKEVVIRFRVDGVLQEAGRIPKVYYENILNRIKVLARLRLDEHFAAQDGAMRYAARNNKMVDLRISLAPTLDGEKIAIRMLSQYIRNYSLRDLGLNQENQIKIEAAAKKPFGMILSTGPTGSGKTTTLYALLKMLNHPDINITTIEDPVEYKLPGINQIQVNNATNLTFAGGLRTIVRQDPDVVLVGEIRDEETAEIAVNAALTGHLLLSTFHANDAATAIPRLLDMGIEPFLLASTLEVVIAQRLVRKLCTVCRYSVNLKATDFAGQMTDPSRFFAGKAMTLYRGKGCDSCNHTGYRGRVGIYEFIYNSREVQEAILRTPSSKEIGDLARAQGQLTLFEDGLAKAREGLTSLEEVLRVAAPADEATKKK